MTTPELERARRAAMATSGAAARAYAWRGPDKARGDDARPGPARGLAAAARRAAPNVIGWAAAATVAAFGVAYLAGPTRASRSAFGLPAITRTERGFLAAKAVRDLGLGLIAATLLWRRDTKAAGAAFAIGAAGPMLDGVVLTLIRGLRPQLGVHWGAAALMTLASRSLLTSGTRQTASARSAR